MQILKNPKYRTLQILIIISLSLIVAFFVYNYWKDIWEGIKNNLVIILSLAAFFFVIILHYLIEKYYKVIDSYKFTHRTKTKKKKKKKKKKEKENTNKITTSQQIKCCDKVFIIIYELKRKLTLPYNKINITTIKTLVKRLEIYATLIASYFSTLFLYRLIKKFVNYITSLPKTDKKTEDLSKNYLDYTIYFGTILTILVIIFMILTLINYMANYSKYGFVVVCTIAFLMLAAALKIWQIHDENTLQANYIILLYIGVLPINYIFICSISKIYSWLHNDEDNLDPAKLTLLWTVIVFILGVIFNIKTQ